MTHTPISKLQALAIAAAKASDWQKAMTLNQEILSAQPQDIAALNRLGMSLLQTGEPKQAKEAFSKVLEIDKTNSIAKKQLERIKSNHLPPTPAFNKTYFIEEPGRTKIAELHRLSGKQVLDTLSVGMNCILKLKNRYISVETENGAHIGALPEDLSFRLAKLIQTGNTYHCSVHSCSNNQCSVYLKELTRSEQNKDVHSFPTAKMAGGQSDQDDRFLLDEDFEDEDGLLDLDDEVEELDSTRGEEPEAPAGRDFEE
jgi:hypothetical protein